MLWNLYSISRHQFLSLSLLNHQYPERENLGAHQSLVDPQKLLGFVIHSCFVLGIFCFSEMNENRKSCADCNATRTPLWRTGPAGPRSLCNACGIRYRKRKASGEGGAQQLRGGEKQSSTCTTSSSSSSYDGVGIMREPIMKLKFLDPGENMMFQRAESPVKKQRNGRDENGGRKLGEVEEAAFLLMSLSCDPVFA